MVYFSLFGPNTVTASFTLGPLLGISSNSCINIIYSKNTVGVGGIVVSVAAFQRIDQRLQGCFFVLLFLKNIVSQQGRCYYFLWYIEEKESEQVCHIEPHE